MTSISLTRQRGVAQPLHLDAGTFRLLFERLGPSLGLWRGAEVAALREQQYGHPVLDLGCGDGLVPSLALPRIDIGVDPNANEIAKAAERGAYARLLPLPVEAAGLQDESIATVVSNSVLEHIPNIDAVLQTIARLLRTGGQLIATCPTEAFSAWLALPFERYAAARNRALAHLNLWTADEWTARLERVGLQVLQVRPYLRRSLVSFWDTLELLQQIWIGRRRVFGLAWRRLPPPALDWLARLAARLDLSAPAPGGGRLIVARKL